MKKDSVVLIWCSGKTVHNILTLLHFWGFEYVNILLTWVKVSNNGNPKQGLGLWTRNNVELLLMAKKGKVGFFKTKIKNIP